MPAQPEPCSLPGPEPVDLRHSRLRWSFTGGLCAAGSSFALTGLVAGWHLRYLWPALLSGVLIALLFWRALRASLGVPQARVRRLIAAFEDFGLGAPLPSDAMVRGWPLMEAIHRCVQRIAAQRDARIEALEQSLALYRPLAEDMPGIELLFGPDGRVVWINPAVEALTGLDRETAVKTDESGLPWIYVKDRPMMRDQLAGALRGELGEGVEMRIQHRDGGVRWYACRWYPLRDEGGRTIGTRFSAQDVQARKNAEHKLLETVAALRRAQALKDHYLGRSNDDRMRLAALLEVIPLGILLVDSDHRALYVNEICADMWRLGPRENLIGLRAETLADRIGAQRVDEAAYRQYLREMLAGRQDSQYDIHCTDGRVIHERNVSIAGIDGRGVLGRVWIFDDISERLAAEAKLVELAERDPLTRTFNAHRFQQDLDRLLADAGRGGGMLGLLSFELANLDEIRGRGGRAAADEALRQMAERIGRMLRRNELLFRTSAEAFALLIARTTPDSLPPLANRLLRGVDSDGPGWTLDISLGVALAPLHGEAPEALMLAAARARGRAKAEGPHCWRMASRWDEGLPPAASESIQPIAPETLQ